MDEPMVAELAKALAVMKDNPKGRKLSYGKIQTQVRDRLGVFAISTPQGVATYFDPEKIALEPSLVNVLAMIEVMGYEIDDLPPHVAGAIRADLKGLRDLLARNAWLAPQG
jgi:hypothetical protein